MQLSVAVQDSSALMGAVPPLVALLRGKTLLAQEQAGSYLSEVLAW